ncbi:glia maturation factor gamma [Sitophilus oryzae]|uniref:Glia maturation factor gamma n=1 Tax=Sitophilus oryzae TaxID=7048 RepID=A0A6J2YG30_SITOR|nr:glia maturation factor gamma [Sitophilus oryzae]
MSGNVNICEITADVKEALKKFRFRKEQDTSALVLKVDREKQQIIIDEEFENISIEDLQENLPGHQPRFIILSYKQEHKDGRTSFPLCFIFFTPRDSHAELQIMYAGSKISLQKEADVNRAFEIRELEDLTEDWLLSKLGK